MFTLENLNTAVDHPGVPFARAADTLALVEAVDSPHLRLNLDLYHAQIGEGNLISSSSGPCRSSARSRSPTCPAAASPAPARSTTRRSPPRWTGSATTGVVGLEGWASGDPEEALEPFRAAFTVQHHSPG